MKKIPTIFKRDPNNMKLVLDEINPECQWVFDDGKDGEFITGVLRKFDGSCCSLHDGTFWRRRTIELTVNPPCRFEPTSIDDTNKKMTGWVPVIFDTPEDKYFVQAFYNLIEKRDGTYELIGPKVQGNPEQATGHTLMRHADAPSYFIANRNYCTFKNTLASLDIEGFIFTHPDGRMGKIKKRDFGFKRGIT